MFLVQSPYPSPENHFTVSGVWLSIGNVEATQEKTLCGGGGGGSTTVIIPFVTVLVSEPEEVSLYFYLRCYFLLAVKQSLFHVCL